MIARSSRLARHLLRRNVPGATRLVVDTDRLAQRLAVDGQAWAQASPGSATPVPGSDATASHSRWLVEEKFMTEEPFTDRASEPERPRGRR